MKELKWNVPYSDLETGSSRQKRMAELVHVELAQILQRRVNDARLQRVNILDVKLSSDLSCATVRVSTYQESECEAVMKALEKASGHLRCLLAEVHYGRRTPRLRFVYDKGRASAERLSALIDQLAIN